MSMFSLYVLQDTPYICSELLSAKRILQKFSELKTRAVRGKLWSRSYFVAAVRNVAVDIVKKYVEEQWVREE